MVKVFTSKVDLQIGIEKALNTAIAQTSKIATEKLKEIINEQYYDLYEPEYYDRTYKFLESATYKIISGQNASIIGIDEDFFSYQYPAKYRLLGNDNQPSGEIGHWTGEDQVYMADAGFHGNVSIYRDGHFWQEFENWCNSNLVQLLQENLRKQGLNVKK